MIIMRALLLVAVALGVAVRLPVPGLSAEEPVKQLILPGESFELDGCAAFILWPPEAQRTAPQPWIWYAPTLPGLPDEHEKWMHEQFLNAGVAVAGIDVGEGYGSPRAQASYDALYRELVHQRGFAHKCCLLGRSRGGLWNCSWAVHHPDQVAGFAGIYPVFDLSAWPGVEQAAAAYEVTPQELTQRLSDFNPLEHIVKLAQSDVPVFLIHGDQDEVVPLEMHSAEFVRRYQAAGKGDLVQLQTAVGQGHNYWQGFFHCQALVDAAILWAKSGAQPVLFNVRSQSGPDDQVPLIRPWKTIRLDPDYRGAWLVAGDLDDDGQAEILSARNHDQNDTHYTSSVVVHRLDGSVMWRWGDATAGRNPLHHDVSAQIYDWDGDGKLEVIVAADRAVVELDGRTGQEKRRFSIPEGASDCLVFCNLAGGSRPTDVLVKTRYTQIWAYDRQGTLLWTANMPGGRLTAHQPRPIDLDGDGRDEIMAGYSLLNPDGSERWALHDDAPAFASGKRPSVGHLDCARLFTSGEPGSETLLALTFCGGDRLAMVDKNGAVRWNIPGWHFESIDVGQVCAQIPGPQIVVDIPYAPHGSQPIWVLDRNGRWLGQIVVDESRFHRLVDWFGAGRESIIVGQPAAMFDGQTGRQQAIFDMPVVPGETPYDPLKESVICLNADMDGDGAPDILYSTNPATTVYIYRNELGARRPGQVPLGTGVNWTLY
jgi:pimeloyl-ACP methyl ester carboxylesterase